MKLFFVITFIYFQNQLSYVFSQTKYQAYLGYNYKIYNKDENYLNSSGMRLNNVYQLEPNSTSVIFNFDLIWSRKKVKENLMSMGGYPVYTKLDYTKNEIELEFGVLMHLRSKNNKKYFNFGLNLNGFSTQILNGNKIVSTPYYKNNNVYYETINSQYNQNTSIITQLIPNIRIERGWTNNINSKLIGNIKIGAEIGRFFILIGIEKRKIIENRT